MNRILFLASAALSVICIASTHAAVTAYTNKANWQNAAGSYTTVDFTGYSHGTLITTQYETLGVTFTDGLDLIYLNSNIFINDGAGLNGAFDEIMVSFASPMMTIAVDHPGIVQFKLFNQGSLIYQSIPFVGDGGVGFFAGLVSDKPFDSAIIYDPSGGVVIDDLHFGPPIPGPAALALLGVAALALSRRRRTM